MGSPENYIISVPDIGEEPKQGLGEVLFEKIRSHGNSIAMISVDTGEVRSYSTLFQQSIRTAIRMKELGISAGDIVALQCLNIMDSYIPFVASQFIGAIFISWDIIGSESDLADSFKQVPVKLIYVSPEFVKKIEKALEIAQRDVKIVVFGETRDHLRFSDFLHGIPDETIFKPTPIEDVRDTACIIFSSGSTGRPKGTCLSHYSLLAQMKYVQYVEDLDTELLEKESAVVSIPIKILNTIPLYWISSYITVINVFCSAMCLVIWQNVDVTKILYTVDKYKIRIASLSATQVVELLKLGRPEDLKLTHPIGFNVAGNMISAENISKFRKMFPESEIYQSYGLTEVTGIVTRFHSLDKKHRRLFMEKPGSCGLPIPGTSYKVVDPNTEEVLGPNKPGELRLKSTLMMNGFYNQDSSDVFDSDGWFKTGDIVYYDEDKCFYVVDRLKTTFKYGVYIVHPAIIEKELINHPAIKNAVVIPVPHEVDVFRPMAVVELKNGAKATEEELLHYINSKMNYQHQLRAGIRIVDNIPLTGTGKVKRKKLINMLEELNIC